MLIPVLALFGLFHHAQPKAGPPPRPVKTYEERFGAWRADYHQDAFTGGLTCTVFAGRTPRHADVSLDRDRLVFHFPDRIETRDAWFRADDGPPRSAAANLLPKLYRYSRVANVDSGTGGLVFIPAAAVAGARDVDIRPNAAAGVRRFDLSRLPDTLAAARARGCPV